MRHVIVGAGAAGLSAARAILCMDRGAEVLLLSDEVHAPYTRPLISYWLAGESPDDALSTDMRNLGGAELRLGARVQAVTPDGSLTLESGETLRWERLLLATGARSRPLGIPGDDAPGIFNFRTLDDARAVDAAIVRGAKRAVVLGGGLVGLKAAHALARRGVETLVAVSSPHPLSQTVGPETGALVAEALGEEGVELRTGLVAEAVAPGAKGALAVRFAGGVELPADLVIRAKGVDPRSELAGIESHRGIPVDDFLGTPLRNVFAAGDAALGRDAVRGGSSNNAIWPVAVEEGAAAGRNMVGAAEPYGGGYARNSVRVGALHVITAGLPPGSAPDHEVRSRRVGRGLRQIILREGVLVGFQSAEWGRSRPVNAGLAVEAVGAGKRLADLAFDPLDPEAHGGRQLFALPVG